MTQGENPPECGAKLCMFRKLGTRRCSRLNSVLFGPAVEFA
jgi:hypothetical protein